MSLQPFGGRDPLTGTAYEGLIPGGVLTTRGQVVTSPGDVLRELIYGPPLPQPSDTTRVVTDTAAPAENKPLGWPLWVKIGLGFGAVLVIVALVRHGR